MCPFFETQFIDRRSLLKFSAKGVAMLSLSNLFGEAQAATNPLIALLEKRTVPAVSYSVISDGRISLSEAVGKKRKNDSEVVTRKTRFQAASLSKTVNAIAILAMVRDGKISLDRPVNEVLRSWMLTGRSSARVTPRLLMAHCGGTTVHGFPGYAFGTGQPDVLDILNGRHPSNTAAVVQDFPVGNFKYSGGGITILQLLAEEVIGKSYSEIVQEFVLEPLGMRDSTMQGLTPEEDVAHAHAGNGATLSASFHNYPEKAAAGLWTSPDDMCRALIAVANSLQGKGDAFLPQKLARAMTTPLHKNAACGAFVVGKDRVTHNGVNAGFRCMYLLNARSGSGYVIMSNGENGEELNRDVEHHIRRKMGW
ncbi:MAG: serine hydrolase domain-containing protein [Salaquimonas sp.]